MVWKRTRGYCLLCDQLVILRAHPIFPNFIVLETTVCPWVCLWVLSSVPFVGRNSCVCVFLFGSWSFRTLLDIWAAGPCAHTFYFKNLLIILPGDLFSIHCSLGF